MSAAATTAIRSAWIESLAHRLQAAVPLTPASLSTVLGVGQSEVTAVGPLSLPEEAIARGLLAQAVLRCALRQGGGLSTGTCEHLVRLLRVSTDRARAKADILRAWTAVARADVGASVRPRGVWAERMRLATQIVEQESTPRHSTAAAIAQRLGVSAATFRREFRRHTGRSFGAFVQSVRMQQAQDLLRRPSLSIKEVAARTGYGHPANLTRAFQAHFGMSPRSFRDIFWANPRPDVQSGTHSPKALRTDQGSRRTRGTR